MGTKDFPVSFGDWLKQRRTRLDLTQAELADRVHCSVFALRKIESGERRPSKQLATALAAGLEIPQEQFQSFIRVARGELSVERLTVKEGANASPRTAPAKSKPRRRGLPWQATPLLGRENEITSIDRLFSNPQCRLLTLTGMGGIGKTRLAIEYAWRQKERFPGGIVYVPLAPVESPDLIAPVMAEALGVVFSGPVNLMGQVVEYLSSETDSEVLLVLDNLEHLIAQSTRTAEIIAEMLQQLPQIKILATSRERINLQGEWMYELHGLPVPPMRFFESLDQYSAAELFIQGATRTRPNFKLSGNDPAAVVRICNLLDGIPLAIELAAAWAGVLSCEEIADEIESNLGFLSTSMRDLPERHRSMRASFEHSWKLLTEDERQVLGQLAVFQGGFLREAAEAVAQAHLQVLASLVSKSLVRRRDDGRYDLHEVIRQYALSNLNGGGKSIQETRDRHCEYHIQMVAEREAKLKSSAQQATLRELAAELDNILAAWNWGVETNQFELLGKAVRGLGWLFEVAGMLNEGIEFF